MPFGNDRLPFMPALGTHLLFHTKEIRICIKKVNYSYAIVNVNLGKATKENETF